jgi:hypothetical protein
MHIWMMLMFDCLCLLRSKTRFMAGEGMMYMRPKTIQNKSEMLLEHVNWLTGLNGFVDFHIVLLLSHDNHSTRLMRKVYSIFCEVMKIRIFLSRLANPEFRYLQFINKASGVSEGFWCGKIEF